jgi:hypothetical protein
MFNSKTFFILAHRAAPRLSNARMWLAKSLFQFHMGYTSSPSYKLIGSFLNNQRGINHY